jgi:hypothetical protein
MIRLGWYFTDSEAILLTNKKTYSNKSQSLGVSMPTILPSILPMFTPPSRRVKPPPSALNPDFLPPPPPPLSLYGL